MKLSNKQNDEVGRLQGSGVCKADDLWRAVKNNPESPLHSLFEWNVQRAAERDWLNTSRAIMAAARTVVTITNEDRQVHAYVRDARKANGDAGYVHVQEVMSDADLARRTVEQELMRMLAALNRARQVADVLGLQDMVDEMLADLAGLQQELMAA